MELVQLLIQETNFHLSQAQLEVNLAKQNRILTSDSTRSAQYAYTWWDWVYCGGGQWLQAVQQLAASLALPA
ncbi:hypothetical protein AAFF_G00028530 [Aldrovandia affinis]|uniref:Uncharacterized protein n=1 Tax=Aldrovandia affinis TaxID=143900 RepID=A0AAD7S4H8_9TELE|nr:hypothetical protein AAFF_G00028530 [Aldrovandia affinis]